MTYQNLTTDKNRNPNLLMTLLYGLPVKMYNLQQNFCVRTYENWQSGEWRIKLNSEKTKVIIFSRSSLARNSEPILKLHGEALKIYPQMKFLGITFDSKFTFQKHFEGILGRCNTRYHRIRFLVNKKWGPSPSTILQIYKQCVRPIFEYGFLSTITTSDTIISKIQRLQNKFIRRALRLPKYISVKLLHDSSGLPYVKDRLLSCATVVLGQNPLDKIPLDKISPRTKSPETKSPWTKSPHYIPPNCSTAQYFLLYINVIFEGQFFKPLLDVIYSMVMKWRSIAERSR